MTICIPLHEHSDNNYLDLRYALRGFEKYMQPDEVIIVGALPAWCKGVTHIQAKDDPDTAMRERNIFEKLLLCPADEFIYCGDDYYLMQPWVEEYAWDMLLANKLYTLGRFSTYQKTVANTLRIMPHGRNYDTHCPITMDQHILHSLKRINWNQPNGYCLQSLYVNAAGIAGMQYPDLKLRDVFTFGDIMDRKWFSTADGVIDKVVPLMEILYPTPSCFEADVEQPRAPKSSKNDKKVKA
jgi:hypothetical protein